MVILVVASDRIFEIFWPTLTLKAAAARRAFSGEYLRERCAITMHSA
jgi:hypothetical protein